MTPDARLVQVEERARGAVADYARKVLEESPLFGRERALAYALGYLEPVDTVSSAENVARCRGALAGLTDADLFQAVRYVP